MKSLPLCISSQISRHFQIEAVFNRGLKLKKMRPQPEKVREDAHDDDNEKRGSGTWEGRLHALTSL